MYFSESEYILSYGQFSLQFEYIFSFYSVTSTIYILDYFETNIYETNILSFKLGNDSLTYFLHPPIILTVPHGMQDLSSPNLGIEPIRPAVEAWCNAFHQTARKSHLYFLTKQ